MAGAQGSRRPLADTLEDKLYQWRSKYKPITLLGTEESRKAYEALEVAAVDLLSLLAGGDACEGLSRRHLGILTRDFLFPCTMNMLRSKLSTAR